jgi:hypothetical protein
MEVFNYETCRIKYDDEFYMRLTLSALNVFFCLSKTKNWRQHSASRTYLTAFKYREILLAEIVQLMQHYSQ